MKYLIIAVLFILSLSYTGCYYLHVFDKRDGLDESIPVPVSSNQIKIPEHLTKDFWRNVTPEQLKEKLKNIENINEVTPDHRNSMLHLLVRYGQYPEMVSLLIDAGVDYNLRNNADGTPGYHALHYAVPRREKGYEFTKELLKYDINVDTEGKYGISPLGVLIYGRYSIKVIRLLLEKGADPNFQYTGKEGGDPSYQDASLLLLASMPNKHRGTSFIDPEVIQLLLDHKADITLKNKEGKTAWDYMKENEEFTKTKLFKKLSAWFQ